MSGNIYLTGDTHGNVQARFSFRKHGSLKDLTDHDTMFILGDWGIFFNPKENPKSVHYNLNFMNQKPWKWYILRGNHDNKSMWTVGPEVQEGVRQCQYEDKIYENIFLIPDVAELEINGHNILCLGGANSHDLFYVVDPRDKKKMRSLRRRGCFFRIVGETWWPDEKMDLPQVKNFLDGKEEKHYDLILSHDHPAIINNYYMFDQPSIVSKPTEAEYYLEELRHNLNYDKWYFAHAHDESLGTSDGKVACLYTSILNYDTKEVI